MQADASPPPPLRQSLRQASNPTVGSRRAASGEGGRTGPRRVSVSPPPDDGRCLPTKASGCPRFQLLDLLQANWVPLLYMGLILTIVTLQIVQLYYQQQQQQQPSAEDLGSVVTAALKKGLRVKRNTTLLMDVFQTMIEKATGLPQCCRHCPVEDDYLGGDNRSLEG